MAVPLWPFFVGSMALSAYGGLETASGLKDAGLARQQSLEFQAAVDEANIVFVRKATGEKKRLATAQGKDIFSSQIAAASVSTGDISDFDRFFLDTLEETHADVEAIMWEGRVTEFNLAQSAKVKRMQGRAEAIGGAAAEEAALIGTATDIAGSTLMFMGTGASGGGTGTTVKPKPKPKAKAK